MTDREQGASNLMEAMGVGSTPIGFASDGKGPTQFTGAAGAIGNLVSELGSSGLPQTNRFQMNIAPPAALSARGPDMLRRLVIRTVAVYLPGNTLATSTDNNIYGPNRNVVQGVEYADSFDAKFLMDEEFELHDYMTSWQRLMYNDKTWNLKYYQDYIGNIDIFVLDKKFYPTAGFRMWECYPSTIGPISFDMGNSAPINDFTVSFNFRYWSDIARYGTKQPTEVFNRDSASLQAAILDGSTHSRKATQDKDADAENAGD